MSGLLEKLNKALKPKDNSAQQASSLRHSNEAVILDSALKLLSKSETGQALVSYAQDSGAQLHVLRGNVDNHGFFPEKSVGYISCPADLDMPPVQGIIHLIAVLRQIAQESTSDLKTPHIRAGKERYIHSQIERSADIRVWQAEVIYQIHEATGFTEIIDSFSKMGYGSVYEAYKLDAEKAAS